jgi:tetratricopeptide (TPR) repeat protein
MKSTLHPLFMRFLFTLTLLLIITPGWASEPEEYTDAASIMAFADNLLHHGHHFRAIMEYERFSHFHPQHPAIPKSQFNTACAMKGAGNYNAALALFTSLAKKYQGTTPGIEASFQKAEVFYLMHDHQSALNHYTEFLSHYPQYHLAEKARSALEKIEKQSPRRRQKTPR